MNENENVDCKKCAHLCVIKNKCTCDLWLKQLRKDETGNVQSIKGCTGPFQQRKAKSGW